MSSPLRLAVLASGGGSNLQALLDAAPGAPFEVALCVSNRADAGALGRARGAGCATAVLDADALASDAATTATLLDAFARHDVNFVALAGYMRKIPPDVVRTFKGRMLNIHPALLPAFGGKGLYGHRVHEAVLAYGVRWTGATVHLVDEEYDTGPIVLQEPVPVHADDTPETLAARVLAVEHRLYPEAVRLFARGRVTIDGRRVVIQS